MTYFGMPFSMWLLFAGSFQKQLTAVFGYDSDTAKGIAKNAKPKYKAIISDLPEFEKADRFKMNIVNCAMLGAFILSMPERPDVERLAEYYANAMMTKPMKWFCHKSGKSKFTEKDIAGMKAAAALKAADRNPYSWNIAKQLHDFKFNVCFFIGISLTDPDMKRLLELGQNYLKFNFIFMKRQKGYSPSVFNIISSYFFTFDLIIIWVNEYEEIGDWLKRL